MASNVFIEWLEGKLTEVGVNKVVPDEEALETAYRRACKYAIIQEAIDRALVDIDDVSIKIPHNLKTQVQKRIEGTDLPWDLAVWEIVKKKRSWRR
jgi:hypothetical protein